LDPISEYEMNQYLFELAKDKTVIFISHRLSTTVMADRIYLLENGEIIEVGSHSELLNRNGKYADMFHKQAEKYIDNRNAKDDRTC
jgi:ATP-binding cassette subfamily B protein